MGSLLNWLYTATAPWLASLGAAAPFALLALRGKTEKRAILARMALVALFFWVCLLLVFSDRAVELLRAPWQGMTLEALFALAVILLAVGAQPAGLVLRLPAGAWRASWLATLLLLVFLVARGLGLRLLGMGSADGAPGWEYLLFQATLPGVAEELAYRGVMLTVLNRALGRPWRLFGAPLGWGWVITTVLFWGIHAFRADQSSGFSFYWQTLTLQLWAGAVFGWIRERSGSVIPAIVSHNLTNIIWSFL